MPGSKTSNASVEGQFAASFMYLKLRREFKEDYMKVEEGKVGIRLKDR